MYLELIKNAIPLTNCKIDEIRKEAISAMASLLSQKPINNVTWECVQLLTNRIEKKNFNVHQDQIYVFGALPLEYLDAPDEDDNDQKEKPTKVNVTSECNCVYAVG